MNLDQLRHFLKVAEHGSFSRAAVALDMSQPAVSRSVRLLEVDLRKTLFHRHGRGIAMTDEGRRLFRLATDVMELLASAHHVVNGSDADLTGRIVIGLPPSLGRALTVPYVTAFSERFPRARVAIVESLTRVLMDRLGAEKIDAALLYDPPASVLTCVEPLLRQSMCLISAVGDGPRDTSPVTLDTAVSLRLVFPTLPNPIRMIIESEATRRGHALDVCYEVDGVEPMLELVRGGFGSTIGTAGLLRQQGASGPLVARPLCEPAIECVVSLGWPKRGPSTLLQQRAIDLLRDTARSTLTA